MDPDLDPIRDHERYRAAMATLADEPASLD
jgi:hypothetical protein